MKLLITLTCTLFLATSFQTAWSQEKPKLSSRQLRYEIIIRSDNDAYLFSNIDRYYTNGAHIYFRKLIPSKQNTSNQDVPKKTSKQILTWFLGQNIYTPSKINKTRIRDLDRPYAGWLFAGMSWEIYPKTHNRLFLKLELGSTGPWSIAEDIQKGLHSIIGFPTPRGWDTQISNELGANLQVCYLHNWQLASWSDLNSETSLQLGTIFQDIEQTIGLRLGKINPLSSSAYTNSRLSRPDLYPQETSLSKRHEIFAILAFSVRRVEHNTLIEGSIWDIESPFVEEARSWLTGQQLGLVYAREKSSYRFIAQRYSPEIEGNKATVFGSIQWSFRF